MNWNFLNFLTRETPEGASAAADGTVVDPAAVVDPPAAVDPDPTPAPQMVPVELMQRRIAAITRQKADLERELELERLNKQLEPPATPPTTAPAPRPNLVNEAQILAEQMRRNEKAQSVVNEGMALSQDFMLRINMMNQTLGQLPDSFLDAVMDAGESDRGAAELLYDLSQDLQKAGNILTMTPTRMAVALTKLKDGKAKPAAPKAAPKAPSAAPAPIGPKGSGGRSAPIAGDLNDPGLGIDDWMRQRNEAAQSSRRY